MVVKCPHYNCKYCLDGLCSCKEVQLVEYGYSILKCMSYEIDYHKEKECLSCKHYKSNSICDYRGHKVEWWIHGNDCWEDKEDQ